MNGDYQSVDKTFDRQVRIVNARPMLLRVGFVLWIVLDVVLIAIFLFFVVGYLVSGSFADVRSMSTLVANIDSMHTTSQAHAAQDLKVRTPQIFLREGGRADFTVDVTNPNADWYATFTYGFDGGDFVSERVRGWLMPGESKEIILLNQETTSRPTNLQFVVEDFAWQRVDKHVVADTERFLASHSDFAVTEATYATDITLPGDSVARSLFTVKNATAYNYWNPTFTVLLTRNGALVGVHQITIPKFISGEERQVEVRWFGQVPASATAKLIPSINYFDPDEYLSPTGEQGVDIRDVSR